MSYECVLRWFLLLLLSKKSNSETIIIRVKEQRSEISTVIWFDEISLYLKSWKKFTFICLFSSATIQLPWQLVYLQTFSNHLHDQRAKIKDMCDGDYSLFEKFGYTLVVEWSCRTNYKVLSISRGRNKTNPMEKSKNCCLITLCTKEIISIIYHHQPTNLTTDQTCKTCTCRIRNLARRALRTAHIKLGLHS